jgi:sugar/nucleoside kinase (ribokinase family)
MSQRRGVLSAGTWCVDLNKTIRRWPEEDTSNEVTAIDRQNGGSGSNMAFDLKRLDPALDVEAMGVVGDDDNGRFLLAQCDLLGVGRAGLRVLADGVTMGVDAFTVAETGRRTHFYFQGVAADLTPDHFDFSGSPARFLHLGLPGAHEAMDRPWRGEANGWVTTLRAARAAGLQTNIELMTTAASRLAALARPCLAHLDFVIVNDFEVGAIAEVETRRADGTTDVAAIFRAIERALACGPMRYVVAHFPEGAVIGGRDGLRFALGSLAMPASEIVGANGAGDAFAAGMLYALHEDWGVEKAARLAHASAAASMRALSTTAGVLAVADCLALADRWGFRPAPA